MLWILAICVVLLVGENVRLRLLANRRRRRVRLIAAGIALACLCLIAYNLSRKER